MGQILLNRLDDSRCEILVRFPVRFFRHFGDVNGIAEVMSRSVCDKADQAGIFAFFLWLFFTQYLANQMYGFIIRTIPGVYLSNVCMLFQSGLMFPLRR